MPGYYEQKLAAERLRKCYELATPAVRAYFKAELDFVLERTAPHQTALELGCGYGRVLHVLAPHVGMLVGIDTSLASLQLARSELSHLSNCLLVATDASRLALADEAFDLVVCIQNGISAFHVDHHVLFAEALRVTRPGGRVLFSTYAERFWDERLKWFRLQSQYGLVGEIDETATGNGRIVCKDGFTGNTVRPDDFRKLAAECGVAGTITEVGGSALFCEMVR
jgi:SAM-dependent methyltransferase